MPADETIEMAEAPPAKRKKGIEIPRWTKAVSLVFLVCLLLFGISRCAKGSSPDNANLAGVNPPAKQDVSRVGFGNDEYNRKIEEYAKERTDAAKESGQTYIPPNVGARPTPVVKEDVKVETPRSPAATAMPAAVPTQQRRAQQRAPRDQQRAQRMQAYMTRLVQPIAPENQAVLVLNTPPARVIPASDLTGGKAGKGSEKQSRTDAAPGLKPGDILYAINRVTLDSDAPGPSMVEIIHGPYRGAKVIGSFKRLNKHLTLEFSSIVMPSGVSYQIQGYAIDPQTDRTAVRSSVDSHYLERFGGLIAASFLEGFGDAVSSSGTSSYSNVYGGGYTIPNYNLSEELWIAAGNVGNRVAGIMERNFDRVPTVTLNSGTDIGVLLISLGSGKNETIGQGISSSQQKAEQENGRMSEPIQRQERIRPRGNSLSRPW